MAKRKHGGREDLAGEYKWGDLIQMILLFVFILAVIIDKNFLKISEDFSDILPSYMTFFLGILFIFTGGALAKSGLDTVFGESRKKEEVVKEGAFKLVRHPVYLGSILSYLGFLMFSMSILGFAVFFIIVAFYYFISRYEERLLLDKFGDEYRDYMKQVPMMNLFSGLIKVIFHKK